ncbi:MAG: hypothetical protein ACJ75J_14685 [Cytophagaceae bacterium]
MINKDTQQQAAADQIYDYAAHQLIHENKSPDQVKATLIEKGMDVKTASAMVDNISAQIKDAKNEGANKDMLYGALWCVGGIVLTLADIGFIFWGAIIFGGYQFIKGLINRA